MVNGQRVQTDGQTEFEHGTATDLALDLRVEVAGTVNNFGILIAEKVTFRSQEGGEVGIKGEVDSVDTNNSTVTVFGLTIYVDSNTELKDESTSELRPFNLGDLVIGDFIEVGGFVNNLGDIVAVKLERKDDPGAGKDELKGPVDSENPDTSLEILSINVDVNGATAFKDSDDNSITAAEFFIAISTTTLCYICWNRNSTPSHLGSNTEKLVFGKVLSCLVNFLYKCSSLLPNF
jgi:hypothetical protein